MKNWTEATDEIKEAIVDAVRYETDYDKDNNEKTWTIFYPDKTKRVIKQFFDMTFFDK